MATNTTLTADIIAKAAVMQLDNNLVMGKQVFRGYQEEFAKNINGYEVGSTITIRRPMDFTVRDGAVMNVQDVTEGKLTMSVDKRKGVDFEFTSQDLTLNIKQLSDRVIKPAMIQLANQIDTDLMALYKDVNNWVGTPGQKVDSFADFAKGPERLDDLAVPQDGRCAVLAPADYWGLVGSQTTLFNDRINNSYRSGSLGEIGNVDTYMAQNVPAHTVGSDVTGVTVNQSVTTSTISYSDVKDSMQQTITIAGGSLNAGDVFTIENVYEVNPVTKASTGTLKQFTVVSYAANTLVFSPAIIWTGAFQTAAFASGVTDLNTKDVTAVGTASTAYRQNMVFRKDAFALVTVPLVAPPGAVDVSRQSYKGINVRVIPVYDGTNDVSKWRLDVLYGVKTVDPRQAVRLSGTA
jgi:hypothetical protein